ncbi:MAG: hypothetical protein ACRDOU_08015 [Streptosporangiaceae bacterium]
MWIVTARVPLTQDRFADAAIAYRAIVPSRLAGASGSLGAVLLLNAPARVAESVSYWRAAEDVVSYRQAHGTSPEEGWLPEIARGPSSCYSAVLLQRNKPLAEGVTLRSAELRCRTGYVDRGLDYLRELAEAELAELPGFRSLFCGVDPPGAQVVLSTSWDTADDLARAERQLAGYEGTFRALAQAEPLSVETSRLAVLVPAG